MVGLWLAKLAEEREVLSSIPLTEKGIGKNNFSNGAFTSLNKHSFGTKTSTIMLQDLSLERPKQRSQRTINF